MTVRSMLGESRRIGASIGHILLGAVAEWLDECVIERKTWRVEDRRQGNNDLRDRLTCR